MHVLQYKLTSLGGMRFLWLLKTWTRTVVKDVSIHSQKKLYSLNSSHTFVSILGDAIFKSRVGVRLKLRASRKLVYETAVVLAGAGRNECGKVEYMCYEVCSLGRLYSDIVQVSLGNIERFPPRPHRCPFRHLRHWIRANRFGQLSTVSTPQKMLSASPTLRAIPRRQHSLSLHLLSLVHFLSFF